MFKIIHFTNFFILYSHYLPSILIILDKDVEDTEGFPHLIYLLCCYEPAVIDLIYHEHVSERIDFVLYDFSYLLTYLNKSVRICCIQYCILSGIAFCNPLYNWI